MTTADRRVGWLLLLAAVTGIAHVLYGDWRPAPGGGPWIVPLAAWLSLSIAAFAMLRHGARHPASHEGQDPPGVLPVLATAVWAVAFFQAVRHLGLVVATLLFVGGAMLMLTPRPLAALRIVLPVALAAALIFWLIFTRIVPVILQQPLLF